jgi:putative phosphoesterase
MKILVMSDSHAGLSFMRRWVQAIKPDAMIHLGDYFSDGETIGEENPEIPMHQVPGNCDLYRMLRYEPSVRCYNVGGVRLFMTHGHEHYVKQTRGHLLSAARKMGAQAALYGHTHVPECAREPDGLWVMNPGTCAAYSGSVGLIVTENEEIVECKILHAEDLEAYK